MNYTHLNHVNNLKGADFLSSGGLTVSNGLTIFADGIVTTGGLTINDVGLEVTGSYSDILILLHSKFMYFLFLLFPFLTPMNPGGGLSVASDGQSIVGGLTIHSNGLNVASGGITSAGGIVSANGLSISSGGLNVNNGGLSVNSNGASFSGGLTVRELLR